MRVKPRASHWGCLPWTWAIRLEAFWRSVVRSVGSDQVGRRSMKVSHRLPGWAFPGSVITQVKVTVKRSVVFVGSISAVHFTWRSPGKGVVEFLPGLGGLEVGLDEELRAGEGDVRIVLVGPTGDLIAVEHVQVSAAEDDRRDREDGQGDQDFDDREPPTCGHRTWSAPGRRSTDRLRGDGPRPTPGAAP